MTEIQVQTVVCGMLREMCYVVSLPGREDCVVIDPGDDAEKILLAAAGRKIAAILLTHCHFDHVGAVEGLLGEDTALVIHRADASGLEDPLVNASWMVGAPRTYPPANRLVDEGDTLSYAGLTFTVLHTPGHTAGSVCYLCGDTLFTGDTVLQGTCGRTDLPTGSDVDMHASLRRLAPLVSRCRCYGGH